MTTESLPDSCNRYNGWAICLVGFAVWTVVIKFFNPLCQYWAEYQLTGIRDGPHILWDFWWVVHLSLAHALFHRKKYAWLLGVGVSIAEILIISVKLFLYFRDPHAPRTSAQPLFDTFLTTSWLLNKSCLLIFFIALLAFLLRREIRKTLPPPHSIPL